MTNVSHQREPGPWPHRLAVLVCATTLPLLFVGGLVTTTQAGMAFPDWPTTHGYNMFLYPWQTWLSAPWDLFVEHGHRLFAALVGILTILLVIVTVWRDTRRWMWGLVLIALAAVVFQGILGGMRVRLDARTIAQVHGCFAPVFFCLTVALAAVSSPRWRNAPPRITRDFAPVLQRVAVVTTLLAYMQIVLGSQLRHVDVAAPPGFFRGALLMHIFLALALLMHGAFLAFYVQRFFRDLAAIRRPARVLAALLLVQIALGAGTWIVKFGWPDFAASYDQAAGYLVQAGSFWQSLIVTAHVTLGSLILATSLLVSLWSLRLVAGVPRLSSAGHTAWGGSR